MKPTDDALIVESAAKRPIDLHAPWGPQIQLGRTEYRCLRCGKDWGEPPEVPLKEGSRTCPFCGFNEAEIIIHKAVPAQLVDGRLVPVVEPKPAKLLTTRDDLAPLRALRDSLTETEQRLISADAALHRLVKLGPADFEVFSFLQMAVHGLTHANIGDFDLRATSQVSAVSLVLPIRALIAEIDRTLANFEKEKSKK